MTTSPLSGQTTVLVGATGNIGRGLITAQLDAGATVVVVGRNEQRLQATVAAFPDAADRLITVQGDVSTLDGADALAQAVADKVEQYDHVVIGINAWMQGTPFWELSQDTWQRTLDVITSYYAASRALVRHIRPGGSITMIHGLAFHVSLPMASPISIYGGALRAMVPAFSNDLGGRVRVNSTAFAQITSANRGQNISPDWLTDEQVGQVMVHLAAAETSGKELLIPDQPTLKALLAGDTDKATGPIR